METLKTKIDSPAAVLLTNIVLAVLIFFILMSDWILSIGLMILFIAGALILDQNGIINLIFDAYNHYKHIAILSGIVLVIMLPFSLTGNNYISHIATVAVCYAIACLGLNFQMGSTDMTNFAPAAFMGLGAYSVAVCTTKRIISMDGNDIGDLNYRSFWLPYRITDIKNKRILPFLGHNGNTNCIYSIDQYH